ncbi:MAG: DUF3106 domain-containing protein, partial [Verrucomicrobia bacterium]|nr:DUF3106 domain-containing protein [Verrucomicrobiota bacterium]
LGALLLTAVRGADGVPQAPAIRVPNPPPPRPPARKSPTDLFRELLVQSPAEREAFLAQRSPAARALIESKLREFEPLPPDQRELRLRVAELQFYLSPLLRATMGERPRLIGIAPVEIRPILERRLQTWDATPASRQQALLDSETALSQFVRFQTSDPAALPQVLRGVPEEQRAGVEAQWRRWIALSPDQRARQTEDFQEFLDLRPAERDRVLRRLSTAERVQMEATLERFRGLPPGQRERAVNGFRRFLDMPPAARASFLENAAQWERLSPAERDAWRRVVERVRNPVPVPMPPERTRPPGIAGAEK